MTLQERFQLKELLEKFRDSLDDARMDPSHEVCLATNLTYAFNNSAIANMALQASPGLEITAYQLNQLLENIANTIDGDDELTMRKAQEIVQEMTHPGFLLAIPEDKNR